MPLRRQCLHPVFGVFLCGVCLLLLQSLQESVRLVDCPRRTTSTFQQEDWKWNASDASFTITMKNELSNTTSRHPAAVLCAIAVNEEAYLDEWVDYHLGLGFDRIYLYDNSETFELQDLRIKHLYIRHFPGPAQQMAAYLDCAKSVAAAPSILRNEKHHPDVVVPISWIAFFDLDEFLVLRRHDTVVDFLSEHCPKGQIGINWYMFHTANETTYRPLPVTKRFQYREATVNQHVKSIVYWKDMDMSKEPHAHFTHLHKNAVHKDTNGQRIENPHPGPFHAGGPTDIAVLHHYHTKSRKEFVEKQLRGRADIATERPNRTQLEQQRLNPGAVWDDSAWGLLKKNVPKYQVFDHW